MGFTQDQMQNYENGSITDFMKRKKEVCLFYYQFLVELLQRTFKSLEAYNYESQREFA